jgi:hypothetical protein
MGQTLLLQHDCCQHMHMSPQLCNRQRRMQGAKLLQEAKGERPPPPTPPAIGARSQWVSAVEAIEKPATSSRTPLDASLETSRAIVLRLLQSIYHTLLAVQLLWAKQLAGPVFTPLELRHLARAMLATLPVLSLWRAGLPPTSSSNLYASILMGVGSTCPHPAVHGHSGSCFVLTQQQHFVRNQIIRQVLGEHTAHKPRGMSSCVASVPQV